MAIGRAVFPPIAKGYEKDQAQGHHADYYGQAIDGEKGVTKPEDMKG